MPRLAGTLLLLAVVVAGTAIRIEMGLGDPAFDAQRPERMLKSDPALLYYISRRILDAGGLPPADFRADPRVEHPLVRDLPALFSVGQEFLTAWSYRWLGGGLPLHVFCVVLWSFVASLAAVGVYGLGRELTGSVGLASLAALVFAASPSSYRTIGFILIREDLSLPLFALHLGLLARAQRAATPAAFALSGLALLAALATWHAMTFVATLEAACLFAWFLRSGRSPLAAPSAWVLLAVVAAGSLLIPVLRARVLLLSPAAVLAWGLAAAAWAEHRGWARVPRLASGLGVVLLLLAATQLLAARGVLADYGHVQELLLAKLRFLGEKPADPSLLSFDARLLWQGPFETASVRELVAGSTAALVLLPVAAALALPIWWRGEGDARFATLVLFALACAALGVLVRRNLALWGLVAGPLCAATLARTTPTRPWLAGVLAAQLLAGATILPHRELHWYLPRHRNDLAETIVWMREHLRDEGAVATDFVNGAALLALTGHPIALQPKYESRESRERIERFLYTFHRGTPSDLRALLERWGCRYLLVDADTLWRMRWEAGVVGEVGPGSAAERFLSAETALIPGFRLRYRSPTDLMRLYELD